MRLQSTATHADIAIYRANSSSAPTARSSASRTARPSRSSSSARTPAALHGPLSAVARGERVSLRYAMPFGADNAAVHPAVIYDTTLTISTGGRQDPPSPPGQVPACRRWCFPRRDQGAPCAASRGSLCCPPAGHQGGQGEAYRCAEREEGREGEDCRQVRRWPDNRTVRERNLMCAWTEC